jgi:cell division initiation protein
MKILPLDIKQQQFSKVLRGFDPAEVKTFLEVISQTFEELIKENNALKDDLRRHINQVNDYREKESTLKETMLTAQKISEDIKSTAKKEAELIVQESELKAERIIGEAHQKMLKIMDRIQDLKLDRERFASSLKSLIEKHQHLIDAANMDDEEDRAQKAANMAYLKTIKNLAPEK